MLWVLNFTPVPRTDYRVGVPAGGAWREVLSSDNRDYGGSGLLNGLVTAEAVPVYGRAQSLSLTLPPLAAILLKASA